MPSVARVHAARNASMVAADDTVLVHACPEGESSCQAGRPWVQRTASSSASRADIRSPRSSRLLVRRGRRPRPPRRPGCRLSLLRRRATRNRPQDLPVRYAARRPHLGQSIPVTLSGMFHRTQHDMGLPALWRRPAGRLALGAQGKPPEERMHRFEKRLGPSACEDLYTIPTPMARLNRYPSRSMIHSTSGAGTKRQLRRGPAMTLR